MRRPRIGRLLRRTVIALAVLVLLLRVAFAFAVVPVLTGLARAQGLALEVDRLESRWHDGWLEVDRLVLRPLDAPQDAPPLLELDHLLVDVDVSATLTGTPRVHRLELDGLRAELERDRDGRWRLPRPPAPDADAEVEADRPAPDEPPLDPERAPFPLRLPVQVGAALLQQVRITVRDLSRAEPFERELALELRLDDLGRDDRPTRLELLAVGPGWLDLLLTRVEARRSDDGGLTLDGEFDLSGLHPDRLAPLLEGTGVEARARTIGGGGRLRARATPLDAGRPQGPLSFELAVEDAELAVDLERAVGVDALRVEVPRWSRAALDGARVTVEGPTARARRDADGALAVLGLVFPPGEGPPEADEPEPETGTPTVPGRGPSIRDAGVVVRGGRLAFDDRAAPEGPVELALELGEFSLDGLSWPIEGTAPPTDLGLTLAVPGTLEALTVEGRLVPRRGGLALSLEIGAQGVSARGSRAYLRAAGLASSLDGGRIDLTVEADVEREADGARGRAVARGLALEDGSGRLVDLGTLTVEDLWFPDGGGLRLGRLAVEEVRLGVQRHPDGDLELAGLRLPGRGPASPFVLGLAAEELGLSGLDLTGADAPPATVRARGAIDGLVEGLALDGELALTDGGLRATLDLAAEGLAPVGLEGPLAELGLRSEYRSGRARGRLELRQGSAVEDGDLSLELTDLALEDAGSELFAVDRLTLGATRLAPLAVGPVELDGLRLAVERDARGRLGLLGLRASAPGAAEPAAAAIDTTVDVEGFSDADPEPTAAAPDPRPAAAGPDPAPTTVAARETPAAGTAPPAANPTATNPTTGARDAERGAAPAQAFGGPLPIPAVALGGLGLERVEVTLTDRSVEGGRVQRLSLAGEVEPLTLGPGATPGALALDLGLDEGVTLALDGRLLGDPDALRLEGRLAGRIADGAALDGLLPEGLRCTLVDGRLAASLALAVTAGAEGGRALELALTEVELADAGGERPALGLARAELLASRLDPADARYAVEALRATGLTAEVTRETDGSLRALGFALAPPSGAGASSTGDGPSTGNGPSAGDGRSAGNGPTPGGRASEPRPLPERLPLVTLETLDLGLERLRLVDRAQGDDAEPLILSGRLINERPWRLLDAEPEALPPIVARLEAAAEPVLGAAELVLTLEPFVDPPHLAAELELRGLSGAGLERAFPVAAAGLEGEALHDGRLTGALDLTLDVRRRHPLVLDLRDGFGAELELGAVELFDAERDERWFGLGGLRVSAQRIRPDTGDVHLASVELDAPFARARVADGALEFLALRLPLSDAPPADGATAPDPAGTEPTGAAADAASGSEPGAGATAPAGAEDGAPAAQAPPAAAEPPVAGPAAGQGATATAAAPELRIDQLLVTGLDVEFADLDAEPEVWVPLRDLDLEVRNFTTRRDSAGAPLTFSALVGAGDVQLPKPVRNRGGLLGSLAEAAVAGLTGERQEVELEARPLFRELGVSGRLDLAGPPTGWIRTHAVGFELLALRGLGRASGVEIGGGVLDANVRVTLEGEQGLELESTTTLDGLSLSEPPGGPISRLLKLPAPLDTVLFLLRDQNGEIRLPVDVRVEEGGLSLGRLSRAVTQALASVISSAVAGSPMRVAGGITGLVGLGSNDQRDDAPVVSAADFAPGATELATDGVATVRAALAALEADGELELVVEARLGAEDLLQVERLSNPSPEETRALARRLEERRAELERRRVEVAAEARTLMRVGDLDGATRQAETRAIETRIGLLERALDDLYRRLRPGAERRAPRRTREAALRLGELRLEALLELLEREGATRLVERVDLRPARLPREQPERFGSLQLSLVRRR